MSMKSECNENRDSEQYNMFVLKWKNLFKNFNLKI